MNAAETSASNAMADCTLLTVVWRSSTTAAIDTFISEVSTTRTNIAIDSSTASRRFNAGAGAVGAGCSVIPGSIPGPRAGPTLEVGTTPVDAASVSDLE